MKLQPSETELKQAHQFLSGIEIPKIPEVILALQKETSKQEPDLSKIGKIMSTDIALSGLVLKTVNSASFGISRQIESISQAVILLGLNTLKEVILVSAMRQSIGDSNPFQASLWKSAQGCALGAKALSFSVDGITQETAYLAGLFHDVGALIIEKRDSEYSKLYLKGLSRPISILDKEFNQYGTNHTVIGYLLAKHWKLPNEVCEAIYNSHIESLSEVEDSQTRALIAILQITEITSARLLHPDIEYSDEANKCIANGYLELAVDGDTLQEMLEKVGNGVW